MNIVVLGIIGVMFVFETWVAILNYKNKNAALPENVKHLYNEEQYKKWLAYSMANFKFGMISSIISTVILIGLLVFGFFGYLETLSQTLTTNTLFQVLIFLFGYYVITFMIGIPFSYYRIFVIEESFGFNKMTKKLFVIDKIKNLLIVILIVGPLLAGLYLGFDAFKNNLLTFAFVAYAGIVLIMLLLFTFNGVFVRWFNKLVPLEQGSLKTNIDTLGKSLGFEVKKIYKMDASKRSTKLNAFFSGLGKSKEVVLFDTLLDKLEEDEVISVLAHELGHATHKDTLKLLVTQLFNMAAYVSLLTLILTNESFYTTFGLEGINFGFAIILMMVLMSPVSTLLSIYTNAISRKMEYKADAFAAKHSSKDAMSRALEKLATENFSNLTPHPVYEFLYYNHPNISKRLEAIS